MGSVHGLELGLVGRGGGMRRGGNLASHGDSVLLRCSWLSLCGTGPPLVVAEAPRRASGTRACFILDLCESIK